MDASWWLSMGMAWLWWGACGVGAYLVGAIPFGLLIAWWRGMDIRAHGSGNIGATNVGRVLGRRWGVLCFVLDLGKGLLPVLAYGLVMGKVGGGGGSGWQASGELAGVIGAVRWLGIGVAAVVGHVFPVYLKFRGGKGVATGTGVLLGTWPVLTGPVWAAAVIWLAVTRLTGYVSLASILAAASLPLMTLGWGWLLRLPGGELAVFVSATVVLAALVVVRHRANLARLRAGTESKAKWAGGDV